MKKITQVIDRLAMVGAAVVCVAIVAALGLTMAEVVARGVLHKTTYIANEYTGYCMAAICFFGYSYCLKENAHIRMDLLDKRLRGRALLLYRCALDVIGLAVTAYLAWFLAAQWLDVFTMQTRSVQVTRTPLWIPQLALPVGACGLCLQFVSELLKNILRLQGDDGSPCQ